MSLAYLSGEFQAVHAFSGNQPWSHIVLLAFNGLIAFGLNVVSFTANRQVGPLGITVAGTPESHSLSLVPSRLSVLSSKRETGVDHSVCGLDVRQ